MLASNPSTEPEAEMRGLRSSDPRSDRAKDISAPKR